MSTTIKFTAEQITKLECDSRGFLEASNFAANYIIQSKAVPTSTVHTSMTTVMLTNLGLGFELKLKALFARLGIHIPKTHILADLFQNLPKQIKSELERIFISGPSYEFIAHMRSNDKPNRPPSNPITSFRDFLAYLDEIGLYNRRYSFETYSSQDWWIEIEPKSIFALMNRITEFSNGL